jgi:hypothetical protein
LKSATKWLKTGPGEVNELRLVTQGGTALLYANGLFVHSYKGTPPEGGSKIGIYTGATKDAAATIEYSEFRIRKPLVMLAASADRTDGLLMTDDFRIFPFGQANEYQSVSNNRLMINPKVGGSSASFYQGKLTSADIRVKIAQVTGSPTDAAGIVFWEADSSNYYAAMLRPDGGVYVSRKELGNWIGNVKLQTVEGLHKGAGEANELRLVTSGDRATLYVNDKEVTSFRGFPPRGGGAIGFHAESGAAPATWAYSDLVVRKGPEPEKSTKPFDLLLLYADDFSTIDPAWAIDDKTSAGEKQLLLTPGVSNGYTKLYTGRWFTDADMRVKIALTKGQADGRAGIVFWAADYKNYHLATIRPDGRLELYHNKDGKFSLVHEAKTVDEISKGVGKVNDLRVVLKGATATVYINDKQVDAIELAAAPEGLRKIGFHAESGKEACVWAYSDLVVRRPR